MNVSDLSGHQVDSIEYAGNMLERHDLLDSSTPSLLEVCLISDFVEFLLGNFVENSFEQNLTSLPRSASLAAVELLIISCFLYVSGDRRQSASYAHF